MKAGKTECLHRVTRRRRDRSGPNGDQLLLVRVFHSDAAESRPDEQELIPTGTVFARFAVCF
jgi:hypothetical protein